MSLPNIRATESSLPSVLNTCALAPQQVESWVRRVPLTSWLTEAERGSLCRKSDYVRSDWIAGRLAAKRTVRRLFRSNGLSCPSYTGIEIRNDILGAPYIAFTHDAIPEELGPIQVSISHSCGYGSAVACNEPGMLVGIDIEVPRSRLERLAWRVLTSAEQEQLRRYWLNEPDWGILVFWTLKEAALKALGCGFRVHPWRVEITFCPEPGNFLVRVHDSLRWKKGISPVGLGYTFYHFDFWQAVVIFRQHAFE